MLREGKEANFVNSSRSASSIELNKEEEVHYMALAPSKLKCKKGLLTQLAIGEKPRDMVWERRRLQMQLHEKKRNNNGDDLTDDDLRELKGCIELGFGFKEEQGQKLCNTLPALDLYFAVNRQLSPTPVSTPARPFRGQSPTPALESPKCDSDPLKINPGDSPQQVKTRLRHWAQAVACSVMQSS